MNNLLAFTDDAAIANRPRTLRGSKQSVKELIVKSHQAAIDGTSTAGLKLEKLEADREQWENTELAASHRRLYVMLTECYSYYLTMKTDKSADVREQYKKALNTFIEVRKYNVLANTHDMNRIVKSVFGVDRRRVSAYSLALRAALVAGGTDRTGKAIPVPSKELGNWLTQQGGVEQVRLGSKNKGLTATERAEVAKTAIRSSVLMTVKPDVKTVPFDTDDVDKMMVLVATYRPSGELEISAVVKNESAVRSALACHFSNNKDGISSSASAAASNTPNTSATSLALEHTQHTSAV